MKRALFSLIAILGFLPSGITRADADESNYFCTRTSIIQVMFPAAEALEEIKALVPTTIRVRQIRDTSYFQLTAAAPTPASAAEISNLNILNVVRALKASSRNAEISELALPASVAVKEEYDKWRSEK